MSGPAPNKFRSIPVGTNRTANNVIVGANPNSTYPTAFTPASETLFDHLVAIDSTLNGYQAEAAAIYVDGVNGNDANAGDELHPVATITQAIVLANVAGGSGRIVVAAGTYVEGDLALTDGWDLEGRNLDTIIATAAVGALSGVTLTGATGNRIKNITFQPAAAAVAYVAAFNINGTGTYDIENCQVIAPAAATAAGGIQALGGAQVRVLTSIINCGAAGAIGIPLNIGGVGTAVTMIDCDVTGNVDDTVDVGTLNLWNCRVTCNNVAGNDAVITLTTAAILGVYDSVLNNVAPGAGPNGYAINWGDPSAVNITLNNAKLQNNGAYLPAGVTVIPEAAGGSALIINNLGFYAAALDINFGALGLDGFENGQSPKTFEGINNVLWAGLGGGISPLVGGDVYDQWEYLMRIARAVDNLINTVTTAVNGGAGVALLGYAGGQIP